MRTRYVLYAFIFLGLASCKNVRQENHGGIVLGDSTTIITETNPESLADFVPDIHNKPPQEDTIALPSSPENDTQDAEKDTLKSAPQSAPAASSHNGKGLDIEFAEVTVSLPGIDVKSFRNQDVKTLNGVSYQLVSGSLQGNQLVVKGATIWKVSQRYISTYVVSKDGKDLPLENMDQITAWKVLKGKNDNYPITGIAPSELEAKKTNAGAIRTALSRTVRAEKMKRTEIREWEALVKKLKKPDQKPVSVMLQSIMWRIEGKDKKGKAFSKEVRIDLPIY